MNSKNKLILLAATALMMLVMTACGTLSDEDSVWNRQREVAQVAQTPSDAGGGAMSFTPGTFEATSEIRGYNGPITVVVTVGEDGAIADIEVTEHRESDGFYQRAFDNLIPLILSSGSTDVDVDATTGATFSATALLSAVEGALSQAGGTPGAGTVASTPAASFTPGTFEATSEIRGYNGPITVAVTIGEDGAIADVEVTEHRESDGFYQRAFDNLIPLILSSGSIDVDVDAASGASFSAAALLDAVRIALEEAQ